MRGSTARARTCARTCEGSRLPASAGVSDLGATSPEVRPAAYALVGHNCRVNDRSPSQIRASHEEAAAIVAALERFMRDTAPAVTAAAVTVADPWQRAAVQEGLGRAERHDLPDPWINT